MNCRKNGFLDHKKKEELCGNYNTTWGSSPDHCTCFIGMAKCPIHKGEEDREL